MRRLGLVLLLAFASAACDSTLIETDSDDGVVRLRISEPRAHVIGGEIAFELTNGQASTLGYNLCGTDLDRYTRFGWQPAGWVDDRACHAIELQLAPGAVASYRTSIRTDIAPGTYRLRATVAPENHDLRTVVTRPFTIDAQ